jgi:hypothetical protein
MARRFYNEQEPGLYEDQSGDLYYDPNTGEFVSASDASSISAPEPAPESQPVRGLSAATTAFHDDDYTGRMGSDGEPERYSTMRGGDPRLAQQRELERQQERLQEPVTIRSWMTTNTKDVRGEKPADNITLQPGRQYQIVDFTGKNNGEVIASGSTPEEFLRMQDIAEGLASRGRMADWRLQEVSEKPSDSKFGSALEPETGLYITTLGGDLYNKSGWSTVADIAKIAVPIALNVIPGLGMGAGLLGKAAAKTMLGKAAGIGLTSAIGRSGAGIATGEKLGEALKAGAISGLASGATAGLLDVSGLGADLSDAFRSAKSAVLGSGKGALVGETVGQGISEAAKKAAEEGLITVVGSKIAPAVLSGISSTSGSLLGNIGKSIDPFQQALDQARLDNEFGLGDTVVTGLRGSTSNIPLAGVSAVAPEGIRFIASPAEVAGQTPASEPPATEEPRIVVTNTPLPKADLSGIGGLGGAAAGVLNLGTPPVDISLPGEDLIDVATSRIRPTRLPDALAASPLSELPGTKTVYEPNQIVVTGQRELPATLSPTDLLAPVAGNFVVSDLTSPQGKSLEQEQAEKKDKKGLTPLQKASAGLTLASALADAVGGGGGGGGPLDLGTGYTVPGAGSGIGRTRNVATFDPFTYGQREGEFQFFNTGPASAPAPSRFSAEPIMQSTGGLLGALNNPIMLQNLQEAMAAEPAFNAAASTGMAEGGEVDDDMVSHLIAYRKGGGHMGPGKVKGIGSGQDDKIPAWLSDGEYVWSAQDVADLGDGSTDEGVRRLDKMRQMVRKGAGRKDVKKIAKPQRGIEDMLKAVGGAV